MGLMDKFKNLFTDEEIIEEDEPVKIKEIKKEEEKTKEHKLPTFMREKIEKEEKEKKAKSKSKEKEKSKEKSKEKEEPVIEKEEFKPMDADIAEEKQNNFKFPVFEDSDFIEPTRASRHVTHIDEEEVKVVEHNKINEPPEEIKIVKTETKVSKLYKDKIEPEEEIKKFKASPIISPIFGVLDKNYIPSEVATRKGGNYEMSRHSKNIDFDSVRKKAYGSQNNTLEEDIKDNLLCENCEYLKKAKSCKKNHPERSNDNDLMYDALCEKQEEDITIDEASENYFDYGQVYEKKQDIDPIYLDEDNDEKVKIVNHASEEKTDTKDIPPVKSSINLLSTIKKSMGEDEEVTEPKEKTKDLELTDDLFNLIDSMYDERDD